MRRRNADRVQIEVAIRREYMEMFDNRQRLHSALGYLSPEHTFQAGQDGLDQAFTQVAIALW